ncbi:unnamed protein product, partial [Thlaspi arvense]
QRQINTREQSKNNGYHASTCPLSFCITPINAHHLRRLDQLGQMFYVIWSNETWHEHAVENPDEVAAMVDIKHLFSLL